MLAEAALSDRSAEDDDEGDDEGDLFRPMYRGPFGLTARARARVGPAYYTVDENTEDGSLDLRALAGRVLLGTMTIAEGETSAYVVNIKVHGGLRRLGIGTALYSAAAKAACSHFGVPLASSAERSSAADSFWKKQERRGRARRVRGYYMLRCPPPRSLAGRVPRAR